MGGGYTRWCYKKQQTNVLRGKKYRKRNMALFKWKYVKSCSCPTAAKITLSSFIVYFLKIHAMERDTFSFPYN
jgi:hypothetical protein